MWKCLPPLRLFARRRGFWQGISWAWAPFPRPRSVSWIPTPSSTWTKQKDGKPYLHLHITASRRDYTCIGGHLLTAYINGACELYVEAFPGVFVGRYADPATGINLYQF